MTSRVLVTIGGILGLLSVALGAYFEHGLKGSVAPESFNSLQIALRHQQLHSVVILVLGFSLLSNLSLQSQRWINCAGLLMIVGVIIFSGSIYLTYIFEFDELRKFAPTGGVITMVGWMSIILSGLTAARQD